MNGADRYTIVAIALHWLIAAAIIALLAIGLTMTSLPPNMLQFRLFQLHKSLGITVLALSVLRLAWRLTHRPPPLPAGMSKPERLAAHGSHWLFYALMFFMPLTGWALVSAAPMNVHTFLYGIVPFPHLPIEKSRETQALFRNLHDTGVWVVIALLVLHVAAALFHHFIRRDAVLHHMLPFVKPKKEIP